jgi:carbonic anhydrase
MIAITRRKFAGILGWMTAGGFLTSSYAQSHGEHAAPAKPAPGPAPNKPVVPTPKPPAAKAIPATAIAPAPPALDRSIAAPEEIWRELMEGNRRFASGKPRSRDVVAARARTAPQQHPYVVVLCCSDSRLSPELIFDQNIGDLFVVRTAGNIADPIALGTIEYAIEHLGSRMLVVLGHEKCGAVSATLSGGVMPTANLTAIVDKIRPGIERLKGLVQGETLMNLAIEANVHHSTSDVIEESPIVRHELAAAKLSVVKAVYNLATGEVQRLSGILPKLDAGAASTHE